MNQNLIRKYEQLFRILVKVDKISYNLDMPSHLKIYSFFYVSMLKLYHDDKDDSSKGVKLSAYYITASRD